MATSPEPQNRHSAVLKLIEIYEDASTRGEVKLATIAALGRAGGLTAMAKLSEIYDDVSTRGEVKLATIKALGEVARV